MLTVHIFADFAEAFDGAGMFQVVQGSPPCRSIKDAAAASDHPIAFDRVNYQQWTKRWNRSVNLSHRRCSPTTVFQVRDIAPPFGEGSSDVQWFDAPAG